MLKRYIGDRAFYRSALHIAIPTLIQSIITQSVGLLDNIMVGRIGTMPMSGVTIANQLFTLFTVSVFGAVSAAGIFTAQFHGAKDHEGVRNTFRYKLFLSVGIAMLFILGFYVFSDPLLNWFLKGEGSAEDAAKILAYGKQYLRIMLVGLIPYSLTNTYCSTLRETGHPTVPMISSTVAMGANLVLNYVLIFGRLGLPAMGSAGAAWATVISRFVELSVVAIWAHSHHRDIPFVQGLYRSFHIPKKLFGTITTTGIPLLMNESIYSVAMVLVSQMLSTISLTMMPAVNISNTIYHFAYVAASSAGSPVYIIMGAMMGRGASEEEIKDCNRKLKFLAFCGGLITAAILLAAAPVFPKLYNTTDEIRHMASWFILLSALPVPFEAYSVAIYATLRSGGRTFITFLFDCGSMWLFNVPLAFLFTQILTLPPILVFAGCRLYFYLRAIFGTVILHRVRWINRLTN